MTVWSSLAASALAPPGGTKTAARAWSASARAEPLGRRWSRRCLSFTLWALAWLACSACLVALPVLGLADAIGRRRWAWCRALLAVWVYLTFEIGGLLGSVLLWLARPLTSATRWVAWNAALQRAWVLGLLGALQRLYGLRITMRGPAPRLGAGPLVVLARHASLIDTLLPLRLLGGWRLRYVLKHELLWDPCLDVVGQRVPNAFVRRGSGDAAGEVARIGALAADLGPGDAAVLFPEGTRFSPSKRERVLARLGGDEAALERARALRHVLPPRVAGARALLTGCPAADVLLVGHVGLERAATLGSLATGSLVDAEVRVGLRHVPAARIPRDQVGFEAWLHGAWAELDAWIETASA